MGRRNCTTPFGILSPKPVLVAASLESSDTSGLFILLAEFGCNGVLPPFLFCCQRRSPCECFCRHVLPGRLDFQVRYDCCLDRCCHPNSRPRRRPQCYRPHQHHQREWKQWNFGRRVHSAAKIWIPFQGCLPPEWFYHELADAETMPASWDYPIHRRKGIVAGASVYRPSHVFVGGVWLVGDPLAAVPSEFSLLACSLLSAGTEPPGALPPADKESRSTLSVEGR